MCEYDTKREPVDYIAEIVKNNSFVPDNIEVVKTFINNYIENMLSYFDLFDKDNNKIVYISGPVTNVPEYKKRFEDMEKDVYKYYSKVDCKCHVINPVKIIDDFTNSFIEEELTYADILFLTYVDILFMCYCLISVSNIIVFDNRDDLYLESKGTLSELSYALGKGNIEIIKYSTILVSIEAMDSLISITPTERCKQLFEKSKEEKSNEPKEE